MINTNNIIKFSEYKDIKLISKDCFTCASGYKKLNLRGKNVETYIYPIFKKLFQATPAYILLESIQNYYKNKNTIVNEEEFLSILSKMFDLGILQTSEENIKVLDKKYRKNNFRQFNMIDNNMYNILQTKSITIINFLNSYDTKPLINELSLLPYKSINLINFYSNMTDIESIADFTSYKNVNTINEKFSNLKHVEKYLSSTNLLITLQSVENIELNIFINNSIVKSNVPWLNCVVNDLIIQIGPFVIPNKTSCYECYTSMNVPQEKYITTLDNENNDDIPFKTYTNFRRSNLYILFGYVLDELLKFMCFEYIHLLPSTINNVITINGLNSIYSIKSILKVPSCKTCNQLNVNYKY